MTNIKTFAAKLVNNKFFEISIVTIILINCVFIAMDAVQSTALTSKMNNICLYIYTVEIILRFIACKSLKEFFSNGWNLFDLFIVLCGYVPEDAFTNGSAIAVLRALRVFRIFKLFRSCKQLRLIITVLVKSMQTLAFNALLTFIFMFVFAVAGIYMFKLPTAETATPEQLVALEQLHEIAPNSPANSEDPYSSLGESLFTLLRAATGEDWTDLRYNLITASKLGLIQVHPAIVTIYHVLWYIFAAFLLLNLFVSAVINNYDTVMSEEKERMKNEPEVK